MLSINGSYHIDECLNHNFLLLGGLCSVKKMGGIMQFLVEHVSFLGLDVQNWMLIVLGMTAVYALFSWKTDKRT
jgi:hypothetical protein